MFAQLITIVAALSMTAVVMYFVKNQDKLSLAEQVQISLNGAPVEAKAVPERTQAEELLIVLNPDDKTRFVSALETIGTTDFQSNMVMLKDFLQNAQNSAIYTESYARYQELYNLCRVSGVLVSYMVCKDSIDTDYTFSA